MVARHQKRAVRRTVGAVGAALLSLVVLSGCSINEAFAFGWPQGGVTPQSSKMFNLWIGSTIAAVAVGVFTWALIFWCIIRYRKRGEKLPPQTRYNMPMEIIYTVAPFLVVSVLFYYTAVVQTDVTRIGGAQMTVNVDASKWNWAFSYPDAKDASGEPVRTVGDSDTIPILVVPTGVRIQFVEHSADVIHSFWVPDLLFKRDVFPGSVTNRFETTINVGAEGAYVGRCAELCGTYHSMMNFEVRAVSQADFDRWLAERQAGKTIQEALVSIGLPPDAQTTHPFPNKP